MISQRIAATRYVPRDRTTRLVTKFRLSASRSLSSVVFVSSWLAFGSLVLGISVLKRAWALWFFVLLAAVCLPDDIDKRTHRDETGRKVEDGHNCENNDILIQSCGPRRLSKRGGVEELVGGG